MPLVIQIVSDPGSWMTDYITKLADSLAAHEHKVIILNKPSKDRVDIRMLLSFGAIVSPDVLATAKSNIVVHGSALPEGKGWSPWSWQILEGRDRLALTLLEAVAGVDAGPIYDQRWITLAGHELIDEWQAKQAEITLSMCEDFVLRFPKVLEEGREQSGVESIYPRRRASDSRLDPERTLASQFGLLRVVDNKRYPAFFEYAGHVYELTVAKKGRPQS